MTLYFVIGIGALIIGFFLGIMFVFTTAPLFGKLIFSSDDTTDYYRIHVERDMEELKKYRCVLLQVERSSH